MQGEAARPIIGLLTKNVCEDDGRLVISGMCIIKFYKGRGIIDTEKIRLDVPFKENVADVKFGKRYGTPAPMGSRITTYRFSFDLKEIRDFDIQNKIIVVYDDKYRGRVLYDALDVHRGKNKNSEIFIHEDMSFYFRQNVHNTMFLTVRDTNRYDYPKESARIKDAKKRSKELKNKDIVLLYEKNCSRYEESASVLYEKLIDKGYKNVYFIADKNTTAIQELDEKYKNNIIQKDSDKHLEYFFACKKFISTETIDHALQLRIANKSVQDKLTGKGLMYVFLQHGVMYMVSLNSELRVGFRQKKNYKLHRTVVSSEAEARHFIELAEMQAEHLYVTGLAKYDTSYRYDDADKIIIMPTWRRWENNQAKNNIEETGYFKMLNRMYESVPKNLRSKTIILPHPLIAEKFKGETAFGKAIQIGESYDRILRNCKLLITDYSSIAYDAFYRGANVVFDWQDLDECMRHYGEDVHLMLNDDNAFGPICRDAHELSLAISDMYGKKQRQKDKENYDRIVEFHDGKNSERIIEKLIQDKMLTKEN